MDKKDFNKDFQDVENSSSEQVDIKNLCVHDLRRRLKIKQRKENITKIVILFCFIILIGISSLFVY